MTRCLDPLQTLLPSARRAPQSCLPGTRAVTAKDVHAAIEAKGIKFDRKKLVLSEPIKALGSFQVQVKLMSGVEATVKVEVTKK